MTINITNLTPHPVTIIRATGTTTYPACAPADLPRATEETVGSDMALTASDGQGQYELQARTPRSYPDHRDVSPWTYVRVRFFTSGGL